MVSFRAKEVTLRGQKIQVGGAGKEGASSEGGGQTVFGSHLLNLSDLPSVAEL